jgi:hypothetical protein
VPNNHELYSLVGWVTHVVVGDSAIALRLWAAIPFLVGVGLVTAWLHVRVGALSGILFLFLATASPLLLDITRQARGYGLAFLAMSVLVVAALEAVRTGRTSALVAVFVAGLVGSWTLPHFAIAFVTIAAVLLTQKELRVRCAVGLVVSVVAVALWYLPHVDDIGHNSLQSYGHRITAAWAITSPIDQTIIPALNSTDDVLLRPSLGSLILAVGFLVVIASSPLARNVTTAFVLGAPVVLTVLVFWATQTNVAPRFFSFLLVPLFVLFATGAGSIVTGVAGRGSIVRIAVVGCVLGVVVVASAPLVWAIPRMPRQAHRRGRARIREDDPTAPVPRMSLPAISNTTSAAESSRCTPHAVWSPRSPHVSPTSPGVMGRPATPSCPAARHGHYRFR